MGATSSKQKARSTLKYDLADRPSPPGKPQLVQQETYPSEPDVVTIRWDPPLYDGGSKLIGYLVEHRRTGSPHWVRASPVLVNQPELTLSGLEPGWRYQFRISAKNAVGLSDPGELSDLLTVTLQRTAASPPCFVKELKDSAALENDKIELKVDVSGTPGPRISWYKDGLEVFSSRRHRISTENGTSTLIIHQAALGDEGEIKCTATNRVGHATTRATLRLEAPPSIRLPRQYEEGLLFEKGEVIRLKVLVAGRPEPDVMWYHNGETVYSGGRYEISHAEKYALLRIQEARRADRGEYHVKGVNKLGEDIASFLVTVTDRPMCPGRAKVVMTMGRSVTLSWTAPDDDGGCKIGNFIVEYYRIGWNMWLKAATCRQLTTTLDDLIEGSEYKFRVKAENPYGVSEPSEESDVVFIPDPKRGLLEPPERGRNNEDDMDIWLENNKRHPSSWLEKPVYNDSDSTTKNKVGKTWSEKNNIHHRETEIKEHILKAKNDLNNEDELNTEKNKPIIPKRKAKTGDKTKNLNQERTFRDKSSHYVEKSGEEENQLRSAKDEELNYGSSEMMLVLLPNSRAQTEERESSNREEFVRHFEEDRSEVAPPMSLSAPELGSGEPIFPPLRGCVSSSELLHELAMTRVYQDLAQYETEKGLKRKHSFDQRKTADCRSITDTDVPEGNVLNHAKDNLSEKFLNQTYEEDNFKIKRIKNTSNEETTGVLKVKQERERPYSTNTYLSNDNKDDSGQYSLQNKLQNLKEYVIDGGRILKKETIDKDEQEEEDGEDRDEEVLDEEEQEEEMEEEEEEEEEEDEEDDEEEVDVQEDEEMAYEKLSDNELDLEETEDKMLKGNLDIIKIGKENSYTTDVWRRDYNEDEETYHPRSMVPMPATAPRLKVQEQETNKSKIKPATDTSLKGDVLKRSNQKDYKQPSVISHISNIKTKEPVNEQKYKMLEKIADNSQNLQTDKEKEKEEMSPHNIENQQSGAGRRYTPSRSPVTLKPILKHRDHSQERTDESKEKRETFVAPIANVEPDLNIVLDSNIELDETEDFLKLRKKQVRIEEPYRNTSISINDTSELVSSRSLSEETDPTKIVINHYSDIVAEFGKGKKTSHSLYLSYDELKAAAITVEEPPEMAFEATERGTNDDVTSQSTSGSFESTSSSQTEDVTDITESEKLVKESSESASAPIVLSYTERKVRWLVDYLTDLAMFLVACWLYACKDERLAIPVLILMAYRQVHEIIMSKIPQRWRRKRL